jgi:hypothetical protein
MMPIEFQPRGEDGSPNFLKVVRMYREERDLSYAEARDLAVREFEKRGWRHPFQERK